MQWTKPDMKKLKKLFPNRSTKEVAKLLKRPVEGVKKKASRLNLKKSKRHMKRLGRTAAIVLACLICLSATARAQDANDTPGLTAWALGRAGVQELRIGYQGLLPDIEVALGAQHIDAADPGVEEWPIRGYLIAHAIDAQMLASAFGNRIALPDGNVYGGLYGEYTYDRENEWSCGYVIGGLVSWPKGWQTVVEYQTRVWNTSDGDEQFLVGLRKEF